MSVKRGAALAAGLVVVAGLVGGCAQKPGVAATVTPVSCGNKAEAALPLSSLDSEGMVSRSCDGGPVVRGESAKITTAEVADLIATYWTVGVDLSGAEAVGALVKMQTVTITAAEVEDLIALFATAGVDLSGPDAINRLFVMRTVVRVADQQGVTVSDDEVETWLDEVGLASDELTILLAKYSIIVTWLTAEPGTPGALTDEQVGAFDASIAAVLGSLDVVVNPRFGTFDPAQFAVIPPAWVQQETPLVGL